MVIFCFQNIVGPVQSIQILSELVLPYYGCFTIHSPTEDWLLVHGRSIPKSFNKMPILFDIFFFHLKYWGPLGFVISVTMIREAIDDFRRYQRNKEVNSSR